MPFLDLVGMRVDMILVTFKNRPNIGRATVFWSLINLDNEINTQPSEDTKFLPVGQHGSSH